MHLRAAAAALLAALLSGCAPQPGPWLPIPAPPPVPTPLPTPDDGWRRSGPAPLPAPPVVLLAADFEGHSPFAAYGGRDADPGGTATRVADGDGHALQLTAAAGALSARSAPIPVAAGRRATLRYRVRAEDLPRGPGVWAKATVLGFRDGKRWGFVESARAPSAESGAGWTAVSVAFDVPAWASAFAVSLDLGRAADDGPFVAGGTAWFDDVELLLDEGRPQPLEPTPDGRGQLVRQGASGPQSRELRSVLAAPAGTAWTRTLDVPPGARLELGAALLPQVPGRGAVRFSVDADAGDGARRLASWTVPARSPSWWDRSVDLAPLAGRRATLTLTAQLEPDRKLTPIPGAPPLPPPPPEPPPGPAGAPAALADAAVWSVPELVVDAPPEPLLLVGVDTLSASRTSAALTPHLAALAERGTAWTHAVSPSPWTLPAFGSLLTGLPPSVHRAGTPSPGSRAGRAPLRPDVPTVAERLRAAGYATRAWINNPFLTRGFGLQRGFDRYIDYATRAAPGASDGAVEEARAWLQGPGPRFAFVHLMEPHGPYRPTAARRPTPTGDALRDGMTHDQMLAFARAPDAVAAPDRADAAALHAAVIADADAALGRLAEAVLARGGTVAVVADHGEELWEHGRFEHGHSAWDELVRVPAVVAPTDPATEPAPTSSVAVTAALLRAAGLPADVPAPAGGRALYGPDRFYGAAGEHRLVVVVDDRGPGARQVPTAPPTLLRDGAPVPFGPAMAADARAAFVALAAEFLPSLRGHWVVAARPAARPAAVSGALIVDGVVPARRRFLGWPDEGGEPMRVERWLRDGTLRFALPPSGGVLALPATGDAHDAVLVELPDGLRTLTRADRLDVAAFFAGPADGAVVAGWVPADGDATALDDATLQQLHSLGYVE